jgi:hypothetical protein
MRDPRDDSPDIAPVAARGADDIDADSGRRDPDIGACRPNQSIATPAVPHGWRGGDRDDGDRLACSESNERLFQS